MEASTAIKGYTGAVYEARMAERANDQQKIEGANAVRLVEAAGIAAVAAAPRLLPPDATFSIRV